jgi:phenylalanyl-tRNA synthetase beta chain
MKVSLSWLQTHLQLDDVSIEKMQDQLTFAGIEVEGIEQRGIESDKIVVAQIIEFVQHPNADRLSVCQVDDGSGTPRQIVCGAKNFKAGDKVPLALPGAKLPGGIEIKEGKLRDVQSNGMMCSGKELGIADDGAGLLILDASLPVGKIFKEVVPPDVIFDLEVTPNRPDLLSHLGLARELAALTGATLIKQEEIKLAATKPAKDKEISLKAPDNCPLYTARTIKNVKVGPSPEWLQRRLQSVGLRPINNIVDITNFVLLDVGQPLHAFDADKLQGGIVIRLAAEAESITALDGNSYALQAADLVIADETKALAIAGVMGGESSGVTDSTQNVILEAAYFTPSHIRRTARRLALSSDSSYRFERGVDPQQVLKASALATKLILEIAGGEASKETLLAGEAPSLTGDVEFDEHRARQLIGVPDLTAEEMQRVLTSLGLQLLESGKETSKWRIPSYRLDLFRSVDLTEEIARVIGLDRVPGKASGAFSSSSSTDRAYDFAMSLRHALVNRGWFEAQTLRLISGGQLQDVLGQPVSTGKAVAVKNPLSEDHTTLRPSIVPGLLATAGLNISQGLQRLRFFELGRVFLMNPNGSTREEERIALLMSGLAQAASWHIKESPSVDFSDLRGIIEALPGLAGQALDIIPKPLEGWLLSAEIKRGSKSLGWIAQAHPSRARDLNARHPIYVAELALSALQQGAQSVAKFAGLQRFPSITRDVALEVPADLPNAKLSAFFSAVKEPLLTSAELFDVFADPTGKKLPSDKKSVAWSLTYRASDRTLDTKEVDEAHGRILKGLTGTLPAIQR